MSEPSEKKFNTSNFLIKKESFKDNLVPNKFSSFNLKMNKNFKTNLLNKRFNFKKFSSNFLGKSTALSLKMIEDKVISEKSSSNNFSEKNSSGEEIKGSSNENNDFLKNKYNLILDEFKNLYELTAVDYYFDSYTNNKKISIEDNLLNDTEMIKEYIDYDEYYHVYIYNNLKLVKILRRTMNFDYYTQVLTSISEKTKNLINDNIKQFDKFKNTLILDLDETLIHSDVIDILKFKENYSKFDKVIEENNIGFNIRPNLNEFLNFASENFNLILLSASNKDYISAVTKELSIEKFFYLILDKEFCIKIDNVFVKDLDIFKSLYDQDTDKEIMLVDNNIFSFAANIKQGILISSFKDNKEDNELISVIEYLNDLLTFKKEGLFNKMEFYNESIFMFEQIMLSIDE